MPPGRKRRVRLLAVTMFSHTVTGTRATSSPGSSRGARSPGFLPGPAAPRTAFPAPRRLLRGGELEHLPEAGVERLAQRVRVDPADHALHGPEQQPGPEENQSAPAAAHRRRCPGERAPVKRVAQRHQGEGKESPDPAGEQGRQAGRQQADLQLHRTGARAPAAEEVDHGNRQESVQPAEQRRNKGRQEEQNTAEKGLAGVQAAAVAPAGNPP